jgi:hypothetical protein
MGFAALYPSYVNDSDSTLVRRHLYRIHILRRMGRATRNPSRVGYAGLFWRGVSCVGLVRAVARIDFDGGFRPPTPGYFSLFGQRKLTKRKAARLPRPAGPLRVIRHIPVPHPSGSLRLCKSAVLPLCLARIGARLRVFLTRRRGPALPGGSPSGCDARRGRRGNGGKSKDKPKVKTAPLPVGCAPRTILPVGTALVRNAHPTFFVCA